MKRAITVLVWVAAALMALLSLKRDEPEPVELAVNVATGPQPTTRNARFPSNPETSGSLAPIEPTEEITSKLNRLYASYLSSPNPGYSNILAALQEVSDQDPTLSDLFKDACTFVSMRTEITRQIQDEEADFQKTREWLVRVNPTSEARTNALLRFNASRKPTLESLIQTEEALRRVFAARFAQRHGLDPELAIERLSSLDLPDAGLELWLRCDETASPDPELRPPTQPGPDEFLRQFRP